jgi:hypothetical protein
MKLIAANKGCSAEFFAAFLSTFFHWFFKFLANDLKVSWVITAA